MKDKKRLIFYIVFVAYCLVMIYFLYFNGRSNVQGYTLSEYISKNVNLSPFHYIKGYFINVIEGIHYKEFVVNVVGNVAIFMPLGLMLPVAFKKLSSLKYMAVLSFLLPLLVETIQIFARVGCFDIDDIILNFIGLLTGFALYKLINKIYKKNR